MLGLAGMSIMTGAIICELALASLLEFGSAEVIEFIPFAGDLHRCKVAVP